ncbi:MAG: serine protease, partial [Gemmatimonadetes bacterium]|nr:serine protease [Gemmatimonadota bacterium]
MCAARDAVFVISSPFDPLASAVLVAPGVLVTNRHVVADDTRVEVLMEGGRRIVGEVVPTRYAGDLVLVRVPGLEGTPLLLGEAGDGLLYAVGA